MTDWVGTDSSNVGYAARADDPLGRNVSILSGWEAPQVPPPLIRMLSLSVRPRNDRAGPLLLSILADQCHPAPVAHDLSLIESLDPTRRVVNATRSRGSGL